MQTQMVNDWVIAYAHWLPPMGLSASFCKDPPVTACLLIRGSVRHNVL